MLTCYYDSSRDSDMGSMNTISVNSDYEYNWKVSCLSHRTPLVYGAPVVSKIIFFQYL